MNRGLDRLFFFIKYLWYIVFFLFIFIIIICYVFVFFYFGFLWDIVNWLIGEKIICFNSEVIKKIGKRIDR